MEATVNMPLDYYDEMRDRISELERLEQEICDCALEVPGELGQSEVGPDVEKLKKLFERHYKKLYSFQITL